MVKRQPSFAAGIIRCRNSVMNIAELKRKLTSLLLLLFYYPPPKAEGYMFVHVRPSVLPSVRPSVRSHVYVTTEQNFMELILNMDHYYDVMHVKFGLAGLGSSGVMALE